MKYTQLARLDVHYSTASWPLRPNGAAVHPARRSLADLRQAFRVLPPSLIIIYFLNACTEAMLMAAYTSLLNSDLGLLPDQVVLYHTVTFLPGP